MPRPTHALGMMIRAHGAGEPFPLTGTDYPTRDGSGLRDYVHVWDLATAHVAALARFDTMVTDDRPATAVNLGTGTGTTVRELVTAFNSVVDTPLRVVETQRRPGDVVGAYTRSDRARELLGWRPTHWVADGIRHALQWAAIRETVLSDGAPSDGTPE